MAGFEIPLIGAAAIDSNPDESDKSSLTISVAPRLRYKRAEQVRLGVEGDSAAKWDFFGVN